MSWILPASRRLNQRLIFAAVFFLAGFALVIAELQISEDRELKELALSGWNCANKPEGSGRSPDTAERNRSKNRFAPDVSGLALKSFDVAGLLKHVADFDAAT